MQVRPEAFFGPKLMVLFLFFFTDSLDATKASKLVSAEPMTLQAAEINSLCSVRLGEEVDSHMPLLLTYH